MVTRVYGRAVWFPAWVWGPISCLSWSGSCRCCTYPYICRWHCCMERWEWVSRELSFSAVQAHLLELKSLTQVFNQKKRQCCAPNQGQGPLNHLPGAEGNGGSLLFYQDKASSLCEGWAEIMKVGMSKQRGSARTTAAQGGGLPSRAGASRRDRGWAAVLQPRLREALRPGRHQGAAGAILWAAAAGGGGQRGEGRPHAPSSGTPCWAAHPVSLY